MILIEQSNGLCVTTEGGRHLFTFSTDPRFRTHIHPLNVPGTKYCMTRFRPVDHPWQYGVFVGLNKVNGMDFWCSGDAFYPAEIRGVMKHREVIDIANPPGGSARFTAVNDWLGPDGSSVLEERQTVVVAEQEAAESFAFDFLWELRASVVDVHIDQSAYGGLSARLVGTQSTKRHLNSAGQTGDACADRPARWVSVAQPVDGVGVYSTETRTTYAYAGLAIFDHPNNMCFPNRWRVDGDGMINPAMALTQEVDIPFGDSLLLRYRIYAFRGVGDADRIESEYQSWKELMS
jgi:hypothetical protein